MPGCAAVGCSNSAKKGMLMKRFPKDPARRKEWHIKMKRDKWKPTDYSYLCEVHFAPDMWEKTRIDGTRKLKSNAVPTIFFFSPPSAMKRKPPIKRKASAPKATKSSSSPVLDSQVVPQNMAVSIGSGAELQPSSSHAASSCEISTPESSASSEDSDNCCETEQAIHEESTTKLARKQQGKTNMFAKWSNVTITKALKLKFSCGGSGYEELLKQGYPLPSVRTLQRRLQNLKFDSGISREVFEFLRIKVESFESHEKDCVLILDEMAITSGNVYDCSLSKYFGNVTPPEHSDMATHVLVFMLGGVITRWKQVVAYYYTSDSVNGAVFHDIIECIFQKAEELQLNILSVTSDMGSCNQALWRAWGVTAGRYSEIKCTVAHPLHSDKVVFVFADVPHLFKNIKSMFISNKVIRIPNDIKEKQKLPTNEVLASHIYEIIAHEKEHSFKLAPKLSERDLFPSHFGKMEVCTSTNVVNHTVSSPLKFLAEELDKPAYLTTAWFLDQVERWFHLMTSRHPMCALSKFNLNVYRDSIAFLKDFMDLFCNMEVGQKKIWKPSQTGVLISTQAMLELQANLLEDRQYKFLLTSRFSQDCLENLFSVLRSKQCVPNAVQVKNNLKLICVSQYLRNASRSSYEEDDREFLSGFLDTLHEVKPKSEEVEISAEVSHPMASLNSSELNSLYNVSGYIVQSIQKTSKTCSTCISAVGSKTPMGNGLHMETLNEPEEDLNRKTRHYRLAAQIFSADVRNEGTRQQLLMKWKKDDWIRDLGFLTDIYEHVNQLNFRLQGDAKIFCHIGTVQEQYKALEQAIQRASETTIKNTVTTTKRNKLSADTIELIERRAKLQASRDHSECKRTEYAELDKLTKRRIRTDIRAYRSLTTKQILETSGSVKKARRSIQRGKQWILGAKSPTGKSITARRNSYRLLQKLIQVLPPR
ncbi:hypothetical protein ANN_26648 [Periplaneta americana]|uniref:THAP-type domain-containing protein n=1 Tax=Periplaneta americana TaxID=6978 RepID=A0ABQ8RYP7_PERAM|nr:hypothetical protein ANN_26648 [Periplaneta americana]